jgi:type IX secretion system PorP/SprF family membrane protein
MRIKAVYNGFLLFVIFVRTGMAQDIHFSQFYESPLLLNPAAAGASAADYRLAVNYKNQWKSVINPFKTAALAFDTKLFHKDSAKNYLGLGLSLFNDKAGISRLTTNQVNIDLAGHFNLNAGSRLSVGVKSGFFQRYINVTGLKWDSQYNGKDYDASRATGELISTTNYSNFDLGAGLLYSSHAAVKELHWQAGLAMTHLTQPKNSFYGLDETTGFKYTGHIQIQYQPKDKRYKILPSVLYAGQGGHNEAVAGSNVAFSLEKSKNDSLLQRPAAFSFIHFGAFYRYGDAVIVVAALEYKKNMKFGMSYDFNVSKFTGASKFRGGPEFSFVYTGFRRAKKKPEIAQQDTTTLPEKTTFAIYQGAVYGEDQPLKAQITVSVVNAAAGKESSGTYLSDSTDGKYKISLTGGESYRIRISSPGFEPFEETVDPATLVKNAESKREIYLTREKPSVVRYTGGVYGEDNRPVKARISVFPADEAGAKDNAAAGEYSSDSLNGKYQAELKTGIKYKIRITAPGFEAFEETVDLGPLNKYTETQKDFHLVAKKPAEKEKITETEAKKQNDKNVSPCAGKPFPDFNAIRKKSLTEDEVYRQMLAAFDDYCAEGLYFKVQVAAYPANRDFNYRPLLEFGQPEIKTYPDGLKRYTLGGFTNIKEAEKLRQQLIAKGVKDAWIVLFLNGKRLTLVEFINGQ